MSAVDDGVRWRVFVAIELPPDMRDELSAAVRGWHGTLDARWTDPAGWHVTLDFLGSVRPADVERLGALLTDVGRRQAPFAAHGGGLQALPSAGRARVLAYRVTDDSGSLLRLAEAVRLARAGIGAAPETRPFTAHVTLARLRMQQRLTEWLAERNTPRRGFHVDAVALMRSHLGRGPARYERLSRFELGAAEVERRLTAAASGHR